MKRIAAIVTTVVLAVSLTACGERPKVSTSQQDGQKQTEQAFEQQSKAVPYPATELRDSLERRNLKKRLMRTNDANKVGYVYFVQMGKFLGYWTIRGKVSSTQSQMTTADLINYACADDLQGCQAVTTTAPGDDGSYGENERGVFFFTTEDVMVQLPEDAYVYSDNPINIGNLPELNSKK